MKSEKDESGNSANSRFKDNMINRLSKIHPKASKELIVKYVTHTIKYIKKPDIDTARELKIITRDIWNSETNNSNINHDIDLSGNTTPTDSNEGS